MNIKQKLDEYLEFDSNLLFLNTQIRVFGGAIRDIICGDNINDIDIICNPTSIPYIKNILELNGYVSLSLHKIDIVSLYSDITVISEPITYIKNKKIVQLIRPRVISNKDRINNRKLYDEVFVDLISNVDINCCGVSYDGINLYQNCQDAILFILQKKFFVNVNSKMYSIKRITQRILKMEDRGWNRLENLNEIRDIKILSILSDLSINYIVE